jgi:SpoIIAA-like
MIDIQLFQKGADTLVTCTLQGRLTAKEYDIFLPHFESEIRHFTDLRVFFDLTELEGWCPGTPWRTLSFNSQHRTDVAKIAIVGPIRQRRLINRACQPLSYKELRRFFTRDIDDAWTWIGE